MKKHLFTLLGVLCLIGSARGAVRTWDNGSGDGRWINGGVSGNWTGAPAPGVADDAVFTTVGGSVDLDNGGIGNSVATITFSPGLPPAFLNDSWNALPSIVDLLTVSTSINQNGAASVDIFNAAITCPSLNMNGGQLQFIGTNLITFTTSVNINGGTLCAEGYSPSSISAPAWNVASGATLKGTGLPSTTVAGFYPTIIGNVNLFPGGTLMAGCSVGTLNVQGDVVCFAAGTAFGFELSQPNVVGGGNDLINLDGDLTLNGTIDVVALPGFDVGTYRLFNYSGGLTDNGVALGTFPNGYLGQLDFSITNQVNLIVSSNIVQFDGLPHSGLGAASLSGSFEQLIVSNIGSSGQDGVAIELPDVSGWEARWEPLDPVDLLTNGAYLQSQVFGSGGSVSNDLLGGWQIAKAGTSNYVVTADFSPLGASTVTLLVFNGTSLVASTNGQSGVLCSVTGCVEDDHWGNPLPTWPPSAWGGALTLLDPRDWTFQGGWSALGDRLVILPEGAPTGISLSEVRLLGGNIPQIVITQEHHTVQFEGLLHQSEGNATLNVSSNRLIISNIGSSGEDGVNILFGAPVDRMFDVLYENPSGDGALTISSLGYFGGQGGLPIMNQVMGFTGNEQTHTYDPSPLGTSNYAIRIFNGLEPVYEKTNNTGLILTTEKFKYRKLPAMDHHMGHFDINEDTEESTWVPGFDYETAAQAIAYDVAGDTTVVGDRVLFIPEDPTTTPDSLSGMKLRCSGDITELTVLSESLSGPHSTFHALGQATLEPSGDHLTIGNIGSSGEDGVRIELDRAFDTSVDLLPICCPEDEQFLFEVFGSFNGVPDQPIGHALFAAVDTNSSYPVSVTADFNAINSPSQHLVLLSNGITVLSITGHTGEVARVATLPIGVGKTFGQTKCIRADYTNNTAFLIDSVPQIGDQLLILAEGSGGSVDYHSAISIRASGLTSFTLTNVVVSTVPVVPFDGVDVYGLGNASLTNAGTNGLVVSNIGSSGQDGVSIDLGTSGDTSTRLNFGDCCMAPAPGCCDEDDWIRFAVWGSFNGVPYQPLGNAQFTVVDTNSLHPVSVTADFSTINSPSQHLVLISNGITVLSITGHTGEVARVSSLPIGIGKTFGQTKCIEAEFPPGTLFLIDGSPHEGDKLLILAETASGHVDYHSAISITAAGIPSFTLSEIFTRPVLGIEPFEEALRISWTGLGILQESGPDVSSWTNLPTATSPHYVAPTNSQRTYRVFIE